MLPFLHRSSSNILGFVFVVLLFFLTSSVRNSLQLCRDPGDCDRETCNDTYAIAPKECHDHVNEMDCFRTCKDPLELLNCFKEQEANHTEEHCVLKYSRSLITVHDTPPNDPQTGLPGRIEGSQYTHHPGVPCALKCQVDPVFWSCVHRCDAKGCFKSFRACEMKQNVTVGNVTMMNIIPCNLTDPGPGFLMTANDTCKICFAERLLEEIGEHGHGDCLVRFSTTGATAIAKPGQDREQEQARRDQLPQCLYETKMNTGEMINDTLAYQYIDICFKDLEHKWDKGAGIKPTAQALEHCYRTLLMHRQLFQCQKAAFTPKCAGGTGQGPPGTRACQDPCLVALTKPYCYVSCPRNVGLQLCKDDCAVKWPVINCTCGSGATEKAFTDFMNNVQGRIHNYTTRIIPTCMTDLLCYVNEIHNEMRPVIDSKKVEDWDSDLVRTRNCKSRKHILELAKGLSFFSKVTAGYPVVVEFDENIGKFSNRYTFRECYLTDCSRKSETDAQHCMRNCAEKLRTSEEMNFVCNGTTHVTSDPKAAQLAGKHNFFRMEIILFCMVAQATEDGLKSFTLTHSPYYLEFTNNFERYNNMYNCEKSIRENDPAIFQTTKLPPPTPLDFIRLAGLTYQLEAAWCDQCLTADPDVEIYHPDERDHAKCVLDRCFRNVVAKKETCKPLKRLDAVVKTVLSAQCDWQMDYTLSQEPYTLWSNYFDEIPPQDQTHNMVHPNSLKYLMKSSIGASRGHYVFPYFLAIRPVCEDGNYDENVYKFIASGGTPLVSIKYYPTTSRQKFIDIMNAKLQGALVNLDRKTIDDEFYIPFNPLNRWNESSKRFDGKTGCHLNVCYPAFLIPQILLHIPIFEAQVSSQQLITKARYFGYTSTLHLRDVAGKGHLKIEDKIDPPTADEFFPVRKVQVYEDSQFVYLWDHLPDYGTTTKGSPGPELEHLQDHLCEPFPDEKPAIGGNPFSPLDGEDFFQLHYTHGNAPQAVMAGFYDPNLVIIGDPDMRRFNLVRWQFEVTSGSSDKPTPHLFHLGYPCFSHNFKVRGFVKPMFSLHDRLDPFYWIKHYRMRYAPKDYRKVNITKAIFSAISLEDRILFVTTSGIVTFYQNFNNTAGLGKAWEVEAGDRLKRCFKIVRVAKRAHPKGDTIVAITYDYQVSEKKKDKSGNVVVDSSGKPVYVKSDVSQQVWVGTYVGKAEPIKWQELTSGLTGENLKEERVFNTEGTKVGQTDDLPDQKLMGIPVQRRETNPKSQIEAICYKAYRSNMVKSKEYVELIEDQGWCDSIDATPVVAVDQKIQVLVRMKVYYSGGTKSSGTAVRRTLVLYVIASFNTDKSASQSSIWQIDSIIPRIPCQDEHRESIPSVVLFNDNYFRKGDPYVIKENYGCHTIKENQKIENQIYLHGMTYTRSYNHHLFLYGNKLLQSTDGGHTFVQLESFPEKGSEYKCEKEALIYHRITVMAFDDLGHYAFLTNKRELWYGNLGSLEQIRLRPSRAYGMVSTRLYELHEMLEAVPFTVFFDSNNELVEMVAVVDVNGTVSRIARRTINERTILRARHFISELEKIENDRFNRLKAQWDRAESQGDPNDRILSESLLADVKYDPLKWSVFCPFSSPHFYHNFSERYGRVQIMYLPSPRQHQQLGNVNTKTTLNTYQAATFNLVWNSFFNYPYRSYSYVETDPFVIWKEKKRDATVLGRLTYLNDDPDEHGILVSPFNYRRLGSPKSEENRIYGSYYMDYGMVAKFEFTFSISNDYTLNPIDYLNHHLDSILLNVDNANGSLIQVNTNREVLASKAAIRYVIVFNVKKNTGIAQTHSGRGFIQVPLKLHLIGGFGTCVPTPATGIRGDSIATVVRVGCPPSLDLVFDWYSTVHSIKFRDLTAHFGNSTKGCYSGEAFCFFARYPLIPHFHVYDIARQRHHNFSGKYIMRIIGGGYSRDNLHDYTPEEQQAFNVPGVSDVSLIWNEWDPIHHSKIQRDSQYVTTSGRNDSREIVLRAGVDSIQWSCHTLSPCARISPRKGMESVYYFKVFVTNRGVDNDTLCLYEKEFVILLYGFPPSPEIQLVTSVIFYVFILTVLYIAYFCLRGHKKMWRSTTLKFYGWFQVIKETLPKSWFKSSADEEEETELEAQRRKDEIILSLQGHLNVPRLLPKETKIAAIEKYLAATEGEPLADKDSKTTVDLPVKEQASAASFNASAASDGSREFVIEPMAARPGPATWTDLIYEQIISRRLAAILERNRQKVEESQEKGNEQK